jgi:hypothetical protein
MEYVETYWPYVAAYAAGATTMQLIGNYKATGTSGLEKTPMFLLDSFITLRWQIIVGGGLGVAAYAYYKGMF